MEWMLMPLKRYAEFEGRSRRMEYWMFQLFQIIVYTILVMIIVAIAAVVGSAGGGQAGEFVVGLLTLLVFVVAIGFFIPNLAVAVRRLHDQGKSGWWYLIALVPFGSIVLLVFMFIEGDSGPNEYGPDPKGEGFDDQTFA